MRTILGEKENDIFRHVQHGLEGLTEEQKVIAKSLMEKLEVGKRTMEKERDIQIEPGNQNQLQVIKEKVVKHYEELKTLEETTEIPATEEQANRPSFQRTTSNGLSEARSSMWVTGRTG